MSNDGRGIVAAAVLCGGGVFSFFWGFTRLRKKRLIENIPTSTVRSLAMGMTELIGKARPKRILSSPLPQTDCIYYRYKIEEYRRSGKSGRWVTIAKGDSCDVPFILEDDTGSVVVYPDKAEIILPHDYSYCTSSFGTSMPQNLEFFMQSSGLRSSGMFGFKKSLRFHEWYIQDGEQVYILGNAQKTKDFMHEHAVKLQQRLDALRADPALLREIDTNQDGEISPEEWDAAQKKAEAQLLEEEIREGHSSELADVVIARGERDKIFIISDQNQEKLIKKLFWQSFAGIYGGAALAIGSFVLLLVQLGLLRF
jgi:hypothetical protein